LRVYAIYNKEIEFVVKYNITCYLLALNYDSLMKEYKRSYTREYVVSSLV